MQPKRIAYLDLSQAHDTVAPMVDVVVLNSRPLDSDMVKACMESVNALQYTNLGVLVFDNRDHALTIGAAYNACAQHSEADWLLFVSDDDLVEADLLVSMVATLGALVLKGEDPVSLTTKCMLLTEQGIVPSAVEHLGMWRRDWLLRHEFDEQLQKHVGHNLVSRLNTIQSLHNRALRWCIPHQLGYVFRQHIGMAGGSVIRQPATMGIA